MKKIIPLIFLILCSVLFSNAQNVINAEHNLALQLVDANKAAIGISQEEFSNAIVSSTFADNATGNRYIYLQQSYKGIPVYNQMLVLAFKNGNLLSNAGKFDPSIEKLVNVSSGSPAVTAESAVQSALSDRGLRPTQMAIAINRKDNGRFVEFTDMGISRENITAQLIWTPNENSTSYTLTWQVYFIPKTNSDYWLVRVDAVNNNILGKDNLTVYCNWDDPNHVYQFGKNHNHKNDISNSEFGGNNLFDFKTIAQLTETKKYNGPTLADNGVYRVIPIPFEAPTFMPGASTTWHAIRNNPWTNAGVVPNAVTLKWHTSTGATDYSYSRGNNVWAYHDRTNQNTGDPTRSANSSTALPNLTFDFTPDYTQEPVVTSPPNQQFNITNLFTGIIWFMIFYMVMDLPK